MSNKIKLFRQKPQKHIEVGGFIIDFYNSNKNPSRNYAQISTVSNNFGMKICGFPFGYLWVSTRLGNIENLHGFCAMMYMIADGVYQDVEFADDLKKAVKDYQDRLMAKGAEIAKSIDEADELASQSLMEDIVSEQGMSKKNLAEKRQADRELMKEILNEDDQTENE